MRLSLAKEPCCMNLKLCLAIAALMLALPYNSFAQTGLEPESLSLTVKLQSAYNPGFTLCMPIEIDNELKFSWTRDVARSSISAFVSKPVNGTYRLKFELKEGVLENIAYDVKVEPDLKPDVPYVVTFTKTSGFELGYRHAFILSKADCK
jgi:hypothetical protein